MRNDKVFIAVALAAGAMVTVFYAIAVQNESRSLKTRDQNRQASIVELESKVRNLGELKESLAQARDTLQQEFAREKEKAAALEDKLAKALFQNKMFMQELSGAKDQRTRSIALQRSIEDLKTEKDLLDNELRQLKAKFELMQPIREKIDGVAQAISSLELDKQKTDVLSVQLASITRDMASVNNYLLQLLKNNVSPVAAPAPAAIGGAADTETAQTSRQELAELKKQYEGLSREHAALEDQYQAAQEALKQSQSELNSRSEKIMALQDRLLKMERDMMQVQSNTKDIEKNAAVLRERMVAVELEKGALRIALEQTKAELHQVQQKFLALLTKIGGIFQPGDEQLLSGRTQPAQDPGKIDVKLFPQESKP